MIPSSIDLLRIPPFDHTPADRVSRGTSGKLSTTCFAFLIGFEGVQYGHDNRLSPDGRARCTCDMTMGRIFQVFMEGNEMKCKIELGNCTKKFSFVFAMGHLHPPAVYGSRGSSYVEVFGFMS
jgi:hypothetical protein